MSVHKFERPDLVAEIITALEQLEISEQALRFFVSHRGAIRGVRDAMARTGKPHLLEMLENELTSLDHEIDVAESMVSDWKEILETLQTRAARP